MENLKPWYKNYFFITALLLIIADQITKLIVKGFNIFGFVHQGMFYGESIPVIGDIIRFTYVENAGMAFGITFGWGKIFLSLFSIAAAIALSIYLHRIQKSPFWVNLGIALILAGASGNLIDRVFYGVIFGENPLFYGHVVDFIQVDIPDINIFNLYYTHFPVFNVADSCVSVGVVLLLFVHTKLPQLNHVFGKNRNKINDGDPI